MRIIRWSAPHLLPRLSNTCSHEMSAEEVDAELVLPGLVGKEEEKQPGKDKADKVTGQRLKQINLGDDSDEDLDAEDEEDVSDL